jgi:ABC-2 type transport system ATP-binding protein
LWQHLKSLNQEGVTIFLTSQYMEEVDQLADRLVIIDRGQIAVEGTPDELKDRIGSNIITVSLQNGAGPDQVQEAVRILAPFAKTGEPTVVGNSISLPTTGAGEALSEIVRSLDRAEISIRGIERTRPTLDDVFLAYTGRKLQDKSQGGV